MDTTAPIVVGTDGSATSGRAVEKAAELALALGAEVHVVSAYSMTSGASWLAASGGVAVADPELMHVQHGSAQDVVTEACADLKRRGLAAQGHVCEGEAADALLTVAADSGAQLLVVGNRGMRGARRVLGSVPNRVSHQAQCAVLIVPTT